MTDSSSLANALSEPLRQPFWWAALASVGLHGVLGVSAPTLSSIIYGGNSSKNLPGSVGLVELTAAEAGRLPQTIPPRPSNTPFSIAPVPLLPSPNLTPPLPPAPGAINLPALPPGMPPPGFFSPLPPAPLAPLAGLSAPPPPRTPSPNLPTPLKTPTFIPPAPGGIQIFPPLPGNFDRNIPPPPPSIAGQPQLPGGPLEDEAETLKRTIASRGALQLFPDGAPVYSPEFPIGPRTSADGVPKLTQKDPNKRNLIAETPEERIRRQQFEAGQQQLGQAGQPGSNISRNRETQLAAANTYVALFERFKKAYPDLEMTGPTPVDVPYPAAACSQKLEGVAVFGAVVNPQGLLRAEPQPIVPTGYSILDNAAKTAIINPNQTFSAASTHKLYQLAVAFKYDEKVCGIPSTGPTRPNPAGQQQPSVAPTGPRPTDQPASPPAEVKPQFEKPPAASTKPKPGVQPSPSTQPKPAPKPSPSPQPKPAAEQPSQPEQPAPSPTPEVSPSPEAAPSPTPEVSPSPAI